MSNKQYQSPIIQVININIDKSIMTDGNPTTSMGVECDVVACTEVD